MKNCSKFKLSVICDSFWNKIFVVESLIKMTIDGCVNLEFTSQYYENSANSKLKFSEERNNYINVLSLALEKFQELKKLGEELEEKNNIFLD